MAIDSSGMLYWIAEAARQLREGAGRKLVHPAASGNMDQSTLYRFERHDGQPTSVDATVAAYADDLDLHPIEIWERALELWRAAIEVADAPEEEDQAPAVVADASARLVEAAGSPPRKAPARPKSGPAAKPRKRA